MYGDSENSDLNPSTRVSLLDGLQAGDRQSLALFHKRYAPLMYGWCRYQWHLNHHDAEDITADLTIKLLVAFERFSYDPNRSFRGWLRRAVKHAVVEFWRSKSKLVFDHGITLNELTCEDDLETRIAEALVLIEARQRVEASCNPLHWQMFIALTEEGRNPEDLAREFGVSRNVVDNAKHRVKKLLKEAVSDLEKEHP